MAQAQKNEATLIVLDKQWRELPADLPHMQARITGERREHLNLLTDADNGRTVLLKPREVFMLRWVSDRPAVMALLETDGDAYVAAPVASLPKPALVTVRRNGGLLAVPSDYGIYGGFLVWHMIAPQEGVQVWRFEYPNALQPKQGLDPPLRLLTLNVEVHP